MTNISIVIFKVVTEREKGRESVAGRVRGVGGGGEEEGRERGGRERERGGKRERELVISV